LTLVELMIAMALGLFLLLGVVSVFLAQRQAYRTNENLAGLQNHARVAFELMAREIRESGLNLCGSGVVGNVIVGASSLAWLNWDAGGLEGYEGDVAMPVVSTGTAEAERVAGTDGIIIRSGTLLDGAVIASHPASSSAITLNTTNHGFSTGNILMACDYRQAVIFQATSASTTSADIGHTSGSQTPGNCSGAFPLDCSSGAPVHSFAQNGYVAPLSLTAWYIGNNAGGGRSLYRTTPAGAAQEIATNVDDLQFEYLTRTGASMATSYVDASEVGSWAPTAAAPVVTVRVTLDLESEEAVGADADVLRRQLIYVVNRRGARDTL
jgi:type IV pilus assembly protein PilW